MSERVRLTGVSPIGDTNPQDMPVTDLEEAITFYRDTLGFTLAARSSDPVPSATMARDGVTLRFAENGGDPGDASCYISVEDVDRARAEMEAGGMVPSPTRVDEHGGKRYRVFFIKDPQGLCYCVGARE